MSASQPPDPKSLRPPKAPPPELRTRAPRPGAVRLRRSVVRFGAVAAGVVVAGSLAWAFVVQPKLRASAAVRPAPAQDGPRGPVRPADLFSKQPARYDELPPPRLVGAPAAGSTPERRSPSPAARKAVSSDMQAAEQARASGLFFASAPLALEARPPGEVLQPSPPRPPAEAADLAAAYNPHRLLAPISPFELKAGTLLPAVLLTAVDTARAGPVVASVSEDVFDTTTGRRLLVPQGARLVGRHNGDTAYGDRRAFLVWERLILPNGKSILLGDEPGVDAQGAVGAPGKADRRIGSLVTASLFAGAITTLGTVARNQDHRSSGGFLGDVGDAAAIEGAQAGSRLIDRELQVRPSIRLKAGAPLRVLITRDLVLEPYAR